MELGTVPAWAALVLSGVSIFYTWRVSKRQDEPHWTFGPMEAGGYQLTNNGRSTAYGMTYKAPHEILEGDDVEWDDDGVPSRLPQDIPGGAAINISAFKIAGATDRRIYVWWYKASDKRKQRQEWSTELPPHPGHQVKH